MGLLQTIRTAFSRPTEATALQTLEDEIAGFRRAGSGSIFTSSHELNPQQLTRAQNLCVKLYRRNPIANRTLKIYKSFLAGEGFALQAANPEAQAVLDEAWTSTRSNLNREHANYARDALLFGEALHPVTWDELGNVTFGFMNPTSIDSISRNPLNNALLETVNYRPYASGELERLDIVRIQGEMLTDTGDLVDDAGLYGGEIHAWLFDRIAAGTRGNPLLLPSLDWLDAYDQILWEMLERHKAMRAYFWDVAVDGGKPEVDKAREMFGEEPPVSGSVRFHTRNVEVKAESPSLGAAEDVQAATFQLRHVSTGVGLAPHWLSEPEDANRSTAEQMDIPVLKGLKDTQAWWGDNMLETGRLFVDRKVAAGMLDRMLERYDTQGRPTGEMVLARDLVTVHLPEITDTAVEKAAAQLASVAMAFVQLDLLGAVDQEVMRQVVRQLLPALGIPADELPDPDDEAAVASALESYARRA